MQATTMPAGETATRLCRAGSKTERPCWRPATEADLGETEPTLCQEHMQLRRRGEDLDGLLGALEATQSFLKSETVEGDPHGVLREFALLWSDEVTEKAAEASHKARLATIAALKEARESTHEEYEKYPPRARAARLGP